MEYSINVVDNDIVMSPHSGGSTTVSVDSTSAKGGNLTQTGQTIVYTPPTDYLGNDTFSYTISSNGETSSGTVYLKGAGSAPTWAGYPRADEAGNVDTASWMGWVYIADDPWIYVHALKHWMYCPEEHVSASGGWGYVPQSLSAYRQIL